jgi:hypothetical protein
VVDFEIRETESSYLAYIIRELRKNMLPKDAEWVISKLQKPSTSPAGSPRGSPRNSSGIITTGGSPTMATAAPGAPQNAEFEALLAKLEEAEGQEAAARAHFKAADKSGAVDPNKKGAEVADGFLSKGELKRYLRGKDKAALREKLYAGKSKQEMFKNLDVDGDAKFSEAEFVAFYMTCHGHPADPAMFEP